MRHVCEIPLRWGDMDALGHVNNVEYLRYLEEVRVRFLLDVLQDIDGGTHGLMAARHEIDYLAPLVWRPEPVPVTSHISRIGNSSFTVGYEIADPGAVYARATTVIVVIDPATGRSAPIPGPARHRLEAYLQA